MRGRSLIALPLALAPVVVSVACYGPTQMRVELLTDMPCADDLRSALYVAGDPTPIAETPAESCASGAPMSSLGDLVFTPGDRAGRSSRVTVRARLAYGTDASGRKRQPADCERDPSQCIFASRTFTYASHEQRRAPVRLYRDCIGKVCGEGETCIQGAACVKDEVVCAGDACSVAGEAVQSSGAPDSGAVDAGAAEAGPVDAGATDAATVACAAPDGGDVLATAEAAPEHTASTSQVFFWTIQDSSSFGVWKWRPSDAGPVLLQSRSGSAGHLAAYGDDVWVGYFGVAATHFVAGPGNPTPLPNAVVPTGMHVAPRTAPASPLAFVLSSPGLYVVDTATGDATSSPLGPVGPSGATHAGGKLFVRAPNGVYVRNVDATTPTPTSPAFVGTYFALGSDGSDAYGARADSAPVIVALSTSAMAVGTATDLIQDGRLAVDATHVYWIVPGSDTARILRLPRVTSVGVAPLPEPELVGFVPTESRDLVVGPAPSSCLYYWSGATLRVRSKSP